MSWTEKLGDLVLDGLPSLLGSALPEHWRRRARERLNDFNPYSVIAGNHDLVRAARLAWIEAAFQILDAAKESAHAFRRESDPQATIEVEKLARKALLQIRSEALDRRTDPGRSPIDRHLQVIMQGTSEFIAPGETRTLEGLNQEFEATLAALIGWTAQEMPPIFGHVARAGLPTIDGKARRNLGELVFAAFAELLKGGDRYPEALPAFNIAMDDAALKLSQAILARVEGLEATIDERVAGLDALRVYRVGAKAYLTLLPQLLEGQARIEALAAAIASEVSVVRDDTRALRDDTGELKAGIAQILKKIEETARFASTASEEETIAEVQRLVSHLNRGEFEQVLAANKPSSVEAYRARCIARWSQQRYAVDKRFTPLTLLLDRGEDAQERYEKVQREFDDLRKVLKEIDSTQEPVLVVTGAPGSGKSTLLRRLELDIALDALRTGEGDAPLTILLPLNAFGQRGTTIPDPANWIAQNWREMAPALPAFDALLTRPLLLLLDGLNEMPHASREDYNDRLAAWQNFLDRLVRDHPNARVVFTCRSLDYGEKLRTKDLPRVPQAEVTPLTPGQVKDFLSIYSPEHGSGLWAQLEGTPQLELYRSPFYLKLLIEQSGGQGEIPAGRAALFTSYVRAMLNREIAGRNPRFQPGVLFNSRDRETFGQWRGPHDLPARGLLFPALSAFAFGLQERRRAEDKAQVRVKYDEALTDFAEEQKEALLKAAADLQILEQQGDDVLFVHQLLQEYFAARHLAQNVNASTAGLAPNINLARVKWLEADITPSVAEELQTMPKSATLPDLRTIGWEETFSLAVAMLSTPETFLRALAEVNLPLAGRCAAQADVKASDHLRADLQQALIARSRDPATDLRARILAAKELGVLGDPRFERRTGPHGAYLLPPMIAVDGGAYRIGSDEGINKDEAPEHEVVLAPFALGRFAVTNAEFRCFIEAKGYEDERWWHTEAAKRWRRGEGTGEGGRQRWRDARDYFKQDPERLSKLAEEHAWSDQQLQTWQRYCAMTDEAFKAEVEQRWPNQRFDVPAFWNDPASSALNQPVVGVCWHEARAYCAWLSAQTGQRYDLPSEAQWEAAARGREARRYAWGEVFEPTRCNSIESKLRRTTPVGVFPAGDTPSTTPGQAFCDLTGNVWQWTGSLYRPYPYQSNDGREDAENAGDPRVLRGGSWYDVRVNCRCATRDRNAPDGRYDGIGFRVCCAPPII